MLEEDPQTIAIKKVFIHEQEHSLHSPSAMVNFSKKFDALVKLILEKK